MTKNYDRELERFTDVLPCKEPSLIPGQYVPLDIALYNPCGMIL